jgi:hypothetical protein
MTKNEALNVRVEVADRYSDTADHRAHSMGFRVAMTLQKENFINREQKKNNP